VIPTSMEGLLLLENLNLSSNQLRGRLPSGGPFANFTESFFMSNLQERWTVWPASKFPNLKE
jgi:LRR receptor-like serine/threonine-protein kinase FLS2